MSEVIRVVLPCKNRRQAFRFGSHLLNARLAASMSVSKPDTSSASQNGGAARLSLITTQDALPQILSKITELLPEQEISFEIADHPNAANDALEDWVRSKLNVSRPH